MPRKADFHVLNLNSFRESLTDPLMAHTLSREGQEEMRKLTLSPDAENPSYASADIQDRNLYWKRPVAERRGMPSKN